MRESQSQKIVTDRILNQKAEQVTATVTEMGFSIIITAGDEDAAYEANHARQLTDAIQENREDFDNDPMALVEFIEDLIEIVEDNRSKEEHLEEWEGRDLNEYDP
jgi:hypothetical protein